MERLGGRGGGGGQIYYINGQVHMAKMAVMTILGKHLLNPLQNRKSDDFKTGTQGL